MISLVCFLIPSLYFFSFVSRTDRYVMSGHQNGAVSIWDTHEVTHDDNSSDSVSHLEPVFSFLAHNDCVNSIRLV